MIIPIFIPYKEEETNDSDWDWVDDNKYYYGALIALFLGFSAWVLLLLVITGVINI
jgi:hypothetical protein